jgi:D-xylose transport system permease protein
MTATAPSASLLRQLIMPAMLAVIWITFSLLDPGFLSPRNLSNLMIEVSITATLAVGVLLVLLPGHTDLSVGMGAGLTGGAAAVLVNQHAWPAPFAMLVALAAAVGIYLLLALFIVRNRIQSFIATLAAMLFLKGLFWRVIESHTVPVTSAAGDSNLLSMLTTWRLPDIAGYSVATCICALLVVLTLRSRRMKAAAGLPVESVELSFLRVFCAAQGIFLAVLVCNQAQGVPLCFLVLCAVAVLVHVLTTHTRTGRYLYAIGGNETAALLSGVPVQRTIVIAFTLMGAIVAITGFMATAYTGASTTTTGDLMELDAIAACVIGGTSLKGGRGTVAGALFGALIMASLLNGLTYHSVGPEDKFMIRGAVLAFAVWLDSRLARRSQTAA